ncbi:MAG: hypothetical protein H0U46_06250 [Actinobacteria bacterium]|nr:hypothetical protein [Actinomycetota bacterium]
MTGHGNAPTVIVRESQRLFPLDLVARIDWLYELAYSSAPEADRHAILTAIRRLRNGLA